MLMKFRKKFGEYAFFGVYLHEFRTDMSQNFITKVSCAPAGEVKDFLFVFIFV